MLTTTNYWFYFYNTYRICVVVLNVFSVLDVKPFELFHQAPNCLIPNALFQQDGTRFSGGGNRKTVGFELTAQRGDHFLIGRGDLAVVTP